jgi:hypothetical protein
MKLNATKHLYPIVITFIVIAYSFVQYHHHNEFHEICFCQFFEDFGTPCEHHESESQHHNGDDDCCAPFGDDVKAFKVAHPKSIDAPILDYALALVITLLFSAFTKPYRLLNTHYLFRFYHQVDCLPVGLRAPPMPYCIAL